MQTLLPIGHGDSSITDLNGIKKRHSPDCYVQQVSGRIVFSFVAVISASFCKIEPAQTLGTSFDAVKAAVF